MSDLTEQQSQDVATHKAEQSKVLSYKKTRDDSYRGWSKAIYYEMIEELGSEISDRFSSSQDWIQANDYLLVRLYIECYGDDPRLS